MTATYAHHAADAVSVVAAPDGGGGTVDAGSVYVDPNAGTDSGDDDSDYEDADGDRVHPWVRALLDTKKTGFSPFVYATSLVLGVVLAVLLAVAAFVALVTTTWRTLFSVAVTATAWALVLRVVKRGTDPASRHLPDVYISAVFVSLYGFLCLCGALTTTHGEGGRIRDTHPLYFVVWFALCAFWLFKYSRIISKRVNAVSRV